jgi:hypothetical protein
MPTVNPELLNLALAKLDKQANMPPMDPAMMGGAPAAPAAAPAPAPTAQPQGQKLKPEQMMQMLDYRLYNMQQQLTAIMNAMGVQVPPESLVLPPGTTGAPPAETALPGGPMAPPPPDPAAGGGGPQPPGGPLPPGGPMPPNAAPVDPAAGKMAAATAPINLQHKAGAIAALRRSLAEYAN